MTDAIGIQMIYRLPDTGNILRFSGMHCQVETILHQFIEWLPHFRCFKMLLLPS